MVSRSIDFNFEHARTKLVLNPDAVRGPTLVRYWQEFFSQQIHESHDHDNTGRPRLSSVDLEVSVAHSEISGSEKLLLLGVADQGFRIGVDVESGSRAILNSLAIRLRAINPFSDPVTTWTLLEAVAKCTGQRISYISSRFYPKMQNSLGGQIGSEGGGLCEWIYEMQGAPSEASLGLRVWSQSSSLCRLAVAVQK